MTNNELMKITDSEKRFLLTKKEIIGKSCKDVVARNINIRKEILDILENDGFDLNDIGTQYLASLITLFYHERHLYRRKDFSNNRYWSLNNPNNKHYKMLGDTNENVLKAINEAIDKNQMDDGPIDLIVRQITDSVMFYFDRSDKLVGYYRKVRK